MSVLVGVDGSPESRAALATAVEEARLVDQPVTAMYVYRLPEDEDSPLAHTHHPSQATIRQQAAAADRSLDEHRAEAQRHAEGVLARVVAEVVDEVDRRRVEQVARPGRAAEGLVEASRDANLLVVGSRGRGGFAGLLLGSVSNQCLRHAFCPVMVIRGQSA